MLRDKTIILIYWQYQVLVDSTIKQCYYKYINKLIEFLSLWIKLLLNVNNKLTIKFKSYIIKVWIEEQLKTKSNIGCYPCKIEQQLNQIGYTDNTLRAYVTCDWQLHLADLGLIPGVALEGAAWERDNVGISEVTLNYLFSLVDTMLAN